MAVITLDDIQFSIDTLSYAIEDLAHEIAIMQNEMDELKERKRHILEEELPREIMNPSEWYWIPRIDVDGNRIHLRLCQDPWDSICDYMSAKNRLASDK